MEEKKNQQKEPSNPKLWGNYLKEFLMIFLAIMLGFFVDNWRENLAEKNMERELMEELVENLKFDTVRYHNNFAINTELLAEMDTLRAELTKAYHGKPNPNRLHHHAWGVTELYSLALLNTNAITELRNSGILRLMENKSLRLNLSDYYERRVKAMDGMDRPSAELGHEIRLLYTQCFGTRDMEGVFKSASEGLKTGISTLAAELDRLGKGPQRTIYLKDKELIDRYITTIGLFQCQLIIYQHTMLENKKAAMKLIEEINKEYHFKGNGKR